jgi:hypothetical protein
MSHSNVELDVFASVGQFFDLFFPCYNFQFWVFEILKIMKPSSRCFLNFRVTAGSRFLKTFKEPVV